tara:strand:- start:341 stop:1369 length:1029 start_codon:yes stop_codon:yes gene_type:complete
MSLLDLQKFIPKSAVKVSYYDNDGTLVKDVTQDQALAIEKLRPGTKFFHTNGNGSISELGINQVIALQPKDLLPQGPPCPTSPQLCGPPKVKIFGGNGIGAIANAIISPNSKSIIGFDIKDPGRNFFSPPYVELVDECGKGKGASARAILGPTGRTNPVTGTPEIGVVNIVVDSPGNGYIAGPDGSLGGNEVVWAEPEEAYIIDNDGNYVVVPEGIDPPDNTAIYFPPRIPIEADDTYQVILEIDDVEVKDPGFGYQPGDTIQVTPDNGAILEPVIQGDEVVGVKVIKPGLGFNDFPVIEVVSDTGYNAEFTPIFKIVDPETLEEIPETATIIQVIDCVGKV